MGRSESPLRERMLFNVGARRSGTYWLQRIVTAHPHVGEVPGETHLFSRGIATLFDGFQHSAQSSPQVGVVYVDRAAALEAVRDLCDAVFAEHLGPNMRYIAERTPQHVLYMPLISEVYPDARFIHIIRDGRDAARSMLAQQWPQGPSTLSEAAAEWRDSVTAGRGARIDPGRYREVRYEELLASPKPTIASIFDWLGLDVGEGVMEVVLTEAARGANVDRFGIGGLATGKWRSAFTDADLEAFDAVAGDLLAELGYSSGDHAGGQIDRATTQGSARRRVRHAQGRHRRAHPRAAPRSAGRALAKRQAIAHEVVEALRHRRLERLEALMASDALVTISRPGPWVEARGPAGRQALAEALQDECLLGGEQVVGEVHLSEQIVVYVLGFNRDGARRDVLVLVSVPERVVTALALYPLPLTPRAGG